MGIIFKDTVGNTNTNQTVLYLQSKSIKANTSVQWNNKIQGYFYNNNSTTTQLIVKSGIGDLNIVMQPYEKFSFPYVDINSVSNVSQENDITMYFSNSEFGFFSTSNNVFITNSSLDMNLLNASVDVNLLNSTVEISNSSLDMNLLNASVDVNLLNSSVDVNLLNSTVEISNSSIDANITNSSLDMNLLNASVDVNLLNSSVDVNLLNSTVEISNSSIDANILNSSIDINIIASTVTLDTDLGNTSLDSQENQTSGTNSLVYNPWGFSTGTAPPVNAQSTLTSGNWANVQQNNARGYLNAVSVYVYNPTSASASADLTIYMYSHLPEGDGSSGNPINSFTFSSGSIDATSGVWLTINPKIFWEYNSLVMISETAGGTGGNAIEVAQNDGGSINAHFFINGYWSHESYPQCMYWRIINNAPASLPVTVQGGEVAVTGTAYIYGYYEYSSGNFNSTTFAASDFVPNGYFAHILGIFFGWAAGTTNSATKIGLILQVNPVNSFIVGYTTMDIASGSYYACAIGESIASNTPIAGVSNSLNGMLNINNLILNSSSTFSLLNSVESPSIASSTPIMTVRYILEPIITKA